MNPDKATKIVKAALVLHNMLRSKSPESYTPAGFADEVVDDNVIDGRLRESNTGSFLESLPVRLKGKIRGIFAEHFYGPGEVPWQWKCLV